MSRQQDDEQDWNENDQRDEAEGQNISGQYETKADQETDFNPVEIAFHGLGTGVLTLDEGGSFTVATQA
jgi:hypothetical protein